MTTRAADPPGAEPFEDAAQVLLYSDDVQTRADVRMAVGRRLAADLPAIAWSEVATHAAVIEAVESGRFAALVLDAEAAKVGGLGICRQVKSEVYDCPPVLVLIARPQDAWLAAWSDADASVTAPIDPFEIREALAGLVRRRLASRA